MLLLATCCLLLATCPLLFAACHLLLATCRLPLPASDLLGCCCIPSSMIHRLVSVKIGPCWYCKNAKSAAFHLWFGLNWPFSGFLPERLRVAGDAGDLLPGHMSPGIRVTIPPMPGSSAVTPTIKEKTNSGRARQRTFIPLQPGPSPMGQPGPSPMGKTSSEDTRLDSDYMTVANCNLNANTCFWTFH